MSNPNGGVPDWALPPGQQQQQQQYGGPPPPSQPQPHQHSQQQYPPAYQSQTYAPSTVMPSSSGVVPQIPVLPTASPPLTTTAPPPTVTPPPPNASSVIHPKSRLARMEDKVLVTRTADEETEDGRIRNREAMAKIRDAWVYKQVRSRLQEFTNFQQVRKLRFVLLDSAVNIYLSLCFIQILLVSLLSLLVPRFRRDLECQRQRHKR